MAAYKYQAISKDGAKVNGVIEAFSEVEAVSRIKQTCNVVLKIQEINEEKTSILALEIDGNKLNAKAFTVMCSQFAIILKAGIRVSRAVQLVADKTTDKKLKKMLTRVAEDVEQGRSLAASFQARGEKFLPVTFIETIRAGEESGDLPGAFTSVYEHYDKQTKMKAKVKSALTYPIFVFVIAIIVVIVLMVKVVPTFTSIFEANGGSIPGITQALIDISNFFGKFWWVIVLVLVLLVVAYKVIQISEGGKLAVAKFKLKLPVLGNINKLNAASEFANTLATLIKAGLPLTRCIKITSRVISNYYVSTKIGEITTKLEEGRSLGDSLRNVDVLPDILVDMVAVGEETGELAETTTTIAGYYDAELEMASKKALEKLEPAILVFVAAIAGFIVIAMYVAMFEMYGSM